MGWRDLLQKADETLVSPWLGGRTLHCGPRSWSITGKLPQEFGWYQFRLSGRTCTVGLPGEVTRESLQGFVTGYLVGDRMIPDGSPVDPNPAKIAEYSETVRLIEPGLDRFVRCVAGRPQEGGPLVYCSVEMPMGPEDDVLAVLLDLTADQALLGPPPLAAIKGVSPALDAAFQMEVWQKAEVQKRRIELERIRLEEEAARQKEERRAHLAHQMGTGEGRREMAKVDFEQAARAALAVSGAEYLDHRQSAQRGEMVVRFRFIGRRFECTCDQKLTIIDSGICLQDHRTGVKGDTWFTLESLPAVIRQAENTHKLVVFRHVDGEQYGDPDDDAPDSY